MERPRTKAGSPRGARRACVAFAASTALWLGACGASETPAPRTAADAATRDGPEPAATSGSGGSGMPGAQPGRAVGSAGSGDAAATDRAHAGQPRQERGASATQREAAEGNAAAEFDERSTDDLLEQARGDLLELGESSFANVRDVSAASLLTLAKLVETLAERAGASRQMAEHVAEMRFQAERLQRADGSAFAEAGWVKQGLVAALAALDGLDVARGRGAGEWVVMARRAADAIPDGGWLSFQHARIQDAFRATVDAFGVALLEAQPCPAGGGVAAGDREPRGAAGAPSSS